MKETAAVLVPPEAEITIHGKTYVIKKVSLRQILRLAHFANQLQATVKDKLITAAAGGANDMLAVLELLADRELAQALEILLDVRGPDHRETLQKIDLEELTDFILVFAKINNLKKLVSNFQSIAAITKDLLPSRTPSPLSSGK